MSSKQLTVDRMESLMRKYHGGCNEANETKMVQCFRPDAVRYFSPGMYDGPFRGAVKIAESWKKSDARRRLSGYRYFGDGPRADDVPH